MKYPVSVAVITYNHCKYIRQTLDGILSQKTTFPFEIVIGEDCSTDDTRKICIEYRNKYPDIIKLRLPEHNQGIFKNFKDTILACNGEYVAYCEGDDWWTNENKLQIQYNYMLSHSECGLCYTDIDIYFEEEKRTERYCLSKRFDKLPKSFSEHLEQAGYIAPLTWFFRKEIFKHIELSNRADLTLVVALEFFLNSQVHFINANTGVYNVHSNSAANQSDVQKHFQYLLGIEQIQLEYADKGSVSQSVITKIQKNNYFSFLPYAVKSENYEYINKVKAYFSAFDIDISPYIEIIKLNKRLDNSLSQIRNSKAYRFGKLIVHPFTTFKKIIYGN